MADIFPVTASDDQSDSLNSGTFLDVSGAPGGHPPFVDTHGNSGRLGRSAYSKNVRTSIHRRKKIFTKSWGGVAWPPWPPWLRH